MRAGYQNKSRINRRFTVTATTSAVHKMTVLGGYRHTYTNVVARCSCQRPHCDRVELLLERCQNTYLTRWELWIKFTRTQSLSGDIATSELENTEI